MDFTLFWINLRTLGRIWSELTQQSVLISHFALQISILQSISSFTVSYRLCKIFYYGVCK